MKHLLVVDFWTLSGYRAINSAHAPHHVTKTLWHDIGFCLSLIIGWQTRARAGGEISPGGDTRQTQPEILAMITTFLMTRWARICTATPHWLYSVCVWITCVGLIPTYLLDKTSTPAPSHTKSVYMYAIPDEAHTTSAFGLNTDSHWEETLGRPGSASNGSIEYSKLVLSAGFGELCGSDWSRLCIPLQVAVWLEGCFCHLAWRGECDTHRLTQHSYPFNLIRVKAFVSLACFCLDSPIGLPPGRKQAQLDHQPPPLPTTTTTRRVPIKTAAAFQETYLRNRVSSSCWQQTCH